MTDARDWSERYVVFVAQPSGAPQPLHLASPLTLEQVQAKGGLVPAAIMGRFEGGVVDAAHFEPNAPFLRVLHRVVARWFPRQPEFVAEALAQGDGNLVVIDGRTPDRTAQVPPVDLLGAFEVEGGVLSTYHPNPEHRLVTDDGWMWLDAPLHDALVAELLVGGA